MSEFVRPLRYYGVPTQAGELTISPSHDFMHHWARNGAWMLKYVANTEEGISLKNVVLHQRSAQWLIENCEVEVCERTFMSTDEHDHWVEFQTMVGLGELDFDIDESTET